MYKDVLECEFGDVAWLFQAVSIRHHCVHRAGLDKEGEQVDISIESIKGLVSKAVELTSKIESEVNQLIELDDSQF